MPAPEDGGSNPPRLISCTACDTAVPELDAVSVLGAFEVYASEAWMTIHGVVSFCSLPCVAAWATTQALSEKHASRRKE